MFQTNQEDLDFGIYKIINYKRKEINYFIDERLKEITLSKLSEISQEELTKIDKEINDIIEKLSEIGIEKDKSAKYLELVKTKKDLLQNRYIEDEIYELLIKFFSRYYKDGDFISQRRFKKNTYLLPYNGEEVKFYWANSDQYYIKTTEEFKDYSFRLSSGRKVEFILVEAVQDKDNNKSFDNKNKYFKLKDNDFIDNNGESLIIYFEYVYINEKIKREIHNKEMALKIINHPMAVNWMLELGTIAPTPKNKDRTLLEKYITEYTSKNMFDYFIHKDLKSFLNFELEMFIKNEVINIEDFLVSDDSNFKSMLSKIDVINTIAKQIIEFLSQIENFQKNLWEKKKFITKTNYCITLDKIPEKFFSEILENKNQIKEWEKLYKLNFTDNKEGNLLLLKNNKFISIDTKFFDNLFKERILSTFDDIDNEIDGILINSDNYHALNLLTEKYRGNIDTIYIDPPYNTNSSPILYKNNYKDSSWLSLMASRLEVSKGLLNETGILIQAIDDIEYKYLSLMTDAIYNKNNYISTITTLCNPQGRAADYVNKTAEYHIIHAKNISKTNDLLVSKIDNFTERNNLKRTGTNSKREERPNRYYPILVKNNEIFMIAENEYELIYDSSKKEFNDEYIDQLTKKYSILGYQVIFPLKKDGTKLVWQRKFSRVLNEYKTYTYENGNIYTPGFALETPTTNWFSPKYSNPEYGTEMLKDLIGDIVSHNVSLNTSKSIYTMQQMIDMNTCSNIILDFFAGSGTTGHAVINYNRKNEQNLRKKYILVEMGEYIEEVTKNRLLRSIYAEKWKNGSPLDSNGVSHVIKYFSLESYEDSLNNISFNSEVEINTLFSQSFQDEYLKKYMISHESSNSSTMLNLELLKNPFEYKMNIRERDEQQLISVDIMETFNYLIGLKVEKFVNLNDIKLFEGKFDKENSIVIWRNLDKIDNLEMLTSEYMENINNNKYKYIFINGDCNLKESNKTKIILIEEEFRKRMFL